jgi:DNA repair protein RadD
MVSGHEEQSGEPAPSGLTLRDYQERVILKAGRAFAAGRRAVIICSPTGSGKSTIGVEIARRHLEKNPTGEVVWTCNRAELIEQACATFHRAGVPTAVVSASSRRANEAGARVRVCSIQTLMAREVPLAPTLVISDEAHRMPAEASAAVLARWPTAPLVGLSATPARETGAGLAPMFDALVVAATVRELTASGYLAPLDIVAPGRALAPGRICMSPVDAYARHGEGRACIVFAPHLAAARAYFTDFSCAGVRVEMVSGELDPATRADRLRAYEDGRVDVLVNVGVLTEGFDSPRTSMAILARRCGSVVLFLQCVGRILRPHATKARALLVDLTGATHLHGRPDADRVYSLEGRAITRGVDAPEGSFCKVCGALLGKGLTCEDCGYTREGIEPPKVVHAPMRVLARDICAGDSEIVRIQRLAKWLKDASERGQKQGAAMHRFKGTYQRFPSSDEIRAAMGKAS